MAKSGHGRRCRIVAVTVGRSDYSIYTPVFDAIEQDALLELQLVVSGAHLSPAYGYSVTEIEAHHRTIAERVEMLLSGDSPLSCAMSMGLGTIGFAQAYARLHPDILLVLGDRFEMHAAAVAAVPLNIPIAHIHGGELTLGAIDDALRHSMTKLAHLHFAATAEYAGRIVTMGEEPWRVTVTGAPGLDRLAAMRIPRREQIEHRFGIPLDPPPLLVTFHPESRQEAPAKGIEEVLAALALARNAAPIVFTSPNADPGQSAIRQAIARFIDERGNAYFVDNLGEFYFGMLAVATAMIGNSSSGLIEAPSFELPVVNIGERQSERIRAANVIDVACQRAAIADAITKATDPKFRAGLRGLVNPYGDGRASERIVRVLRETTLDEQLLKKRFFTRTGQF